MSVDACAELVRRGDPDRFRTALTAPMPARADLMVIYAFAGEVARAPWVTSEPLIAEMRLQWWVDAVDEIFDATPRRHEVVDALSDVVARHDLPRDLLQRMIAARRADAYGEAFADADALDGYLRDTSAGPMEAAARVLGAGTGKDGDAESAAIPVVQEFAFAAGAAAFVRALPSLRAAEWTPIADTAMLRALLARAGSALRGARQRRKQVPGACLPALLAGWRVDGTLKVAGRNPEAAFATPAESSEFATRTGLFLRHATGRW